jgi:hypothetical protein
MTPVAGGIPDGEEYWLVVFDCLLECFITPGVPVNRIMWRRYGLLSSISLFVRSYFSSILNSPSARLPALDLEYCIKVSI